MEKKLINKIFQLLFSIIKKGAMNGIVNSTRLLHYYSELKKKRQEKQNKIWLTYW